MTYRALQELGVELDGAIARSRRRRPGLRTLLLTLVATLCLTGGVAAASYLLTGSPIPGAQARDVPDEATPLGSTARLMGLDAADPAGGRAWDVRVSRSRTGQLCVAVGQVADGRLGIVGLDGRFRAVPALGYDTCGQAPMLLGARVFDAPRREDVRTVVSGVAGRGVRRVEVAGRVVPLGAEGSFVTVFAGYPEDVEPVVRVHGPGERVRTIPLAVVDRPRAADPERGWWTVHVSDRRDGRACAQVLRERTRDVAGGGMSAPACGDLRKDPFFFEVAALPSARPDRTFPWDSREPRTMVWGAAREDVSRITIDGAPVDLSRDGFVAAFPEGTRPADLTVEVTLRGGAVRRLVGSQNLRAADGSRVVSRLREPVRVPAELRAPPTGSWLVPDAASPRIATRVADPAGGPDWAVRTFSARMKRAVAARRGEATRRRLHCAQLGRIVDGRFAAPSGRAPLPLDDPTSACTARDDLVRRVDTFVDDARAYAPRLQRTVEWGFGPRRGPFLTLREPERSARGSIAARAPDPDGGAPYGLLTWRSDEGERCRYAGRIVGDTAGMLDPRSNRFAPYPVREGGSCGPATPPRAQPLTFSVGAATSPPDPDSARIRRSLPGRTIISGFAHPDVQAITIQTPRDVRTLRPAGAARAFLAVYDGEFFSGTVTLTARFADGTTHRTTMPVGG